MVRWGAALAIALLAALAVALWSAQRSTHAARTEAAALRDELETLRGELDTARERNLELDGQLTWLRGELDRIASAPAQPAAEPAPAESVELTDDEAQPSEELFFDEQALTEGGVPAAEIARLRESFDASEMALIELRNQAMREGWLRTGRYWNELRELRMGLREEIGDDAFDLMLYATGRSNRVIVTDVLRGSPGEQAGLQAGDVILSYAGQRIFKAPELQQATSSGRPGERVAMYVLRDGREERFFIPRGPVGTKLKAGRLLPQSR